MRLFDKIMKLFNKKNQSVIDVPVNKFYKGDDLNGFIHFTYTYDDENPVTKRKTKLSLKIGSPFDVGKINKSLDSNLLAYECYLSYGQTKGPSLTDEKLANDIKGFDKVILCIDRERMIRDSNYSEFVFSKMLNYNRIKKLHDIQYGLVEGRKTGNYVGSVIENNGNLVDLMDYNIGDVVNVSFSGVSIHVDDESLLKTIELLRQERDKLREASKNQNEYQSNRTK